MPHTPELPIDPYNPPSNYEVFKIQAGALYIDRGTLDVVEGYFVIEVGNSALEEAKRIGDDSLSYAIRLYLRRLTLVHSDLKYPVNFDGLGIFGFTEVEPDD